MGRGGCRVQRRLENSPVHRVGQAADSPGAPCHCRKSGGGPTVNDTTNKITRGTPRHKPDQEPETVNEVSRLMRWQQLGLTLKKRNGGSVANMDNVGRVL